MKPASFTKEFIINEHTNCKKLALQYYIQKNYGKALKAAAFTARIAFHYPILYNFIDDELEDLLFNISSQILNKNREQQLSRQRNRIVFYDTFIVDSAQFTEQFLNYFIERKYEVLFIVPNDKHTISGKRILKTISENPNVELFIPELNNEVGRIEQIYNKIIRFSPTRAVLEFMPDDVIGFCVFANLDKVEKYYIDLSYQTFWLGKLCSDYFLEFYKGGWLCDIERRNIDREHLRYLNIYPVTDKNKFEGFPFNRTDKIVGLSGGQLYKYLVDPELSYFKIIKDLIKENPDFVFCLAGSGMPTSVVEDFIKTNELEERFYLLGKRSDFNELVKHSDIYFESYPVKGGLTVLFAIENKIPVVGLVNKNNNVGLEDLLSMDNFKQGDSFEEFYKEADKLIKSKEERERNISFFQQCHQTKYYFDKGLDEILAGINNSDERFKNERLNYDDAATLNEYLLLENADFKYYLEKIYYLRGCLSLAAYMEILSKLFLTLGKRSAMKLLIHYFSYAFKLKNKQTTIT